MAIKMVDISDAGVIESIRSGLPGASEQAKGLWLADDYKTGPRSFQIGPKTLVKIGNTATMWEKNFLWCIATLLRYAVEVSIAYTRNTTDSTYGYAVKRNIYGQGNDFLKAYKKGDDLYIYNTSNTDRADLVFFSIQGLTVVGTFENLDDTYEEVQFTTV